VVSITRHFGHAGADPRPADIVGARATGWFFRSPRILVTAAHFARTIPTHGWQEVVLSQASGEGSPGRSFRTEIRIVRIGAATRDVGHPERTVIGPGEDLAVLELRDPMPGAKGLDVTREASSPGERAVALAYPFGNLRFATGTVRSKNTTSGDFSGLLLFEVQDVNRLLLNTGASGGPVLDCRQGRVSAVITTLLTMPTPPGTPTPAGTPTNTAVPARVLWARG
jgi:hypothetical protein